MSQLCNRPNTTYYGLFSKARLKSNVLHILGEHIYSSFNGRDISIAHAFQDAQGHLSSDSAVSIYGIRKSVIKVCDSTVTIGGQLYLARSNTCDRALLGNSQHYIQFNLGEMRARPANSPSLGRAIGIAAGEDSYAMHSLSLEGLLYVLSNPVAFSGAPSLSAELGQLRIKIG